MQILSEEDVPLYNEYQNVMKWANDMSQKINEAQRRLDYLAGYLDAHGIDPNSDAIPESELTKEEDVVEEK